MDGETIEGPVDDKTGELVFEGHAHRECILLNGEAGEFSLLVSLADSDEEAKKGLDAELVRAYFEKRGIKEKTQVDELVDWFMEYMEKEFSEARSAWALEKAKDPAALRALYEKYPVRPAAPVEEKREARVFCVLVPLLLTDEDEVRLAGRRLPRERLAALASELKNIFAGTEEYVKISPLRCRRMRMFIGERFVPVSDADEAETLLKQEALKLVDNESAGPFLSVPPSCRVRGSELLDSVRGKDKFALVPVMLPVILVGSAFELNYCERLLKDTEEEIEQVSGIICSMINGMFDAEVVGPVPVVPIWEAEIVADEMLSGIAEQENAMPDFPSRAGKAGRAKLKRIK